MKKNNRPITKVKNAEPKIINENWVIWAAGQQNYLEK